MRTETDQIERVLIGFPVNENEIGFEMTIPVIFPLTDQGMVVMARRERLAADEPLAARAVTTFSSSSSIVFRWRPFFSRR